VSFIRAQILTSERWPRSQQKGMATLTTSARSRLSCIWILYSRRPAPCHTLMSERLSRSQKKGTCRSIDSRGPAPHPARCQLSAVCQLTRSVSVEAGCHLSVS
jgi:hypothetical protein